MVNCEVSQCAMVQTLHTQTSKCLSQTHLYYCLCIYCSKINRTVIYSNLSSVTFILKTHCVVVARQNGTLALEKLKS